MATPSLPPEAGDVTTEGCRAAIWIGVDPPSPTSTGGAQGFDLSKTISAYVDEHYPGTQVGRRSRTTFCLRCAGPLAHVMTVADDLASQVRSLAEAQHVERFAARMGIVVAAHGENLASLLRRAKDAAENVEG